MRDASLPGPRRNQLAVQRSRCMRETDLPRPRHAQSCDAPLTVAELWQELHMTHSMSAWSPCEMLGRCALTVAATTGARGRRLRWSRQGSCRDKQASAPLPVPAAGSRVARARVATRRPDRETSSVGSARVRQTSVPRRRLCHRRFERGLVPAAWTLARARCPRLSRGSCGPC